MGAQYLYARGSCACAVFVGNAWYLCICCKQCAWYLWARAICEHPVVIDAVLTGVRYLWARGISAREVLICTRHSSARCASGRAVFMNARVFVGAWYLRARDSVGGEWAYLEPGAARQR